MKFSLNPTELKLTAIDIIMLQNHLQDADNPAYPMTVLMPKQTKDGPILTLHPVFLDDGEYRKKSSPNWTNQFAINVQLSKGSDFDISNFKDGFPMIHSAILLMIASMGEGAELNSSLMIHFSEGKILAQSPSFKMNMGDYALADAAKITYVN